MIAGEHDGNVLSQNVVQGSLGDAEDIAKTGYFWKTEEASEERLVPKLEALISLILDRCAFSPEPCQACLHFMRCIPPPLGANLARRLDENSDGSISRDELVRRRHRMAQAQEAMLAKRGSSLRGHAHGHAHAR